MHGYGMLDKVSHNGKLGTEKEFSYSFDNKIWTEWGTLSNNNNELSGISLSTGDKIYIKSDSDIPMGGSDVFGDTAGFSFQMSGKFNVSGNIMSLLNYSETLPEFAFKEMFRNLETLIDASKLQLPATTLANYCYDSMFRGCSKLVNAPELPATTLADSCYNYMFRDCSSLVNAPSILPANTLEHSCYSYMFDSCTSLVTAPELPATTLANNCYYGMLYGCSSLETAPELPATTLAEYCYSNMFSYCTSLVNAPELPATTLANYCYDFMFYNCSKLNYIKAMFTTTPSTTYTSYWVLNVSSTGTFVKNKDATWDVRGVSGIPEGWTVETA